VSDTPRHPNIAGVVELDASIMDGATRRAGAAMARGASPTEAAGTALRELFELPTDGVLPLMHIVVLSPTGEHAAATTLADASYTWQDETVAEHAVSERLVIAP
jgi:hypothetical protein